MRHRKRGRKLDRTSSHRRALLRNLARALILSKDGRIWTTLAKAKEARPFVEKLVTLGRYGDEASRRNAQSMLGEHRPSYPRSPKADEKNASKWVRIPPKPSNPVDRKRWRRLGLPALPSALPVIALDRLFAEIAPKFKDRPGGYTRILRGSKKIGEDRPLRLRRLNDKAPMAILEFVVPVGVVQEPSSQPPSPEKASKKKEPAAPAS